MKTELQEPLAKILKEAGYVYPRAIAAHLVPHIGRALRAAYTRGFSDGANDGTIDTVESLLTDNGVTAGVAAMMEEK